MNKEIKKRGRKTKEERIVASREKLTNRLILMNKYFREPKYYKNNYWSWAAWDSWAAQGKSGSCPCGCGYYNGTLHNTRKNTDKGKGGQVAWLKNVSPNLCYDCITMIERKLDTTFKRR
jgi:hypothetical protein